MTETLELVLGDTDWRRSEM